jgi:hypothetical protein
VFYWVSLVLLPNWLVASGLQLSYLLYSRHSMLSSYFVCDNEWLLDIFQSFVLAFKDWIVFWFLRAGRFFLFYLAFL